MRRIKHFVLFFIVLIGLFFLSVPEVLPNNLSSREISEKAKDSDIIIFFNSGGWGNTPLERAEDFAPIILEIQGTLSKWGYDSAVIPYNRTKAGFWGKIAGAKDFLTSFEYSSEILAGEIESLGKDLPDKKIIITGLSAGGAFVSKTYGRISEGARDSILAIAAGIPFWVKDSDSDNVLQLDNGGTDSLAMGEIRTLLSSLIISPLRWVGARISGESLSLKSITNQFVGHSYNWRTAGPEIISFLTQAIEKGGKEDLSSLIEEKILQP
ncbi:MAG: hypothetical protein Q8P74_01535 [bacterium]|nr:hypothetical protein [bacterium]